MKCINIQIFKIQYNHWINDTLFSLKWWMTTLIVVILWAAWWKISDKKRFNEICLAGFIAAVLNLFFNTAGVEMALWAYPTQILGLVRTWSLFEVSFITFICMLLYQYFKEWKNYLIAVVISGALGSFVVQPLLISLNMYKLVNLKNLYSFPIYILFRVIIKFIASKIIDIQKSSIKCT